MAITNEKTNKTSDTVDLNTLLKTITPEESFYQQHPGELGPAYQQIKQVIHDDQLVYQFELPFVNQHIVEIRKDSRFAPVPPFIHTNVNLNYIYSGHCTYVVDGQELELRQGDVCLFDTDVLREKKTTGFDDIVINISLANRFFTSDFVTRLQDQGIVYDFLISALSESATHDSFIVFKTHHDLQLIRLFTGLLQEYFGHPDWSVDVINAYMTIIFTELMRRYNTWRPDQVLKIHQALDTHMLPILQYLEANAATTSLQALAKHFGYHPNYLAGRIKTATGETFTTIRTRKRMDLAARLLITTTDNVDTICHHIGMSNLSSFYRDFSMQYCSSPAAYRRKFGRT